MSDFFADYLHDHHLDIITVHRMTGVSCELLGLLCNGYKTLPSIALRIGTVLNMTPEQVQEIGKPLDKNYWRVKRGRGKARLNAPGIPDTVITLDGSAIELDEEWYKQVGKAKYKAKSESETPKRRKKAS